METEDICEEYKSQFGVEDWAYCLNVSMDEPMFQTRNWTEIKAASENDSCTAFLQSFLSHKKTADVFDYLIPIICFLGVVGNALNILVLTRGKLLSTMDTLERSATFGLIALALSDLLFCALVFPKAFLVEQASVMYADHGHVLYYRLYSIGAINTFAMISSWLIVIIAVNRLVVVMYPLHARLLISGVRTVLSTLAILIIGTLMTVPFYLIRLVRPCVSLDGTNMVEAVNRYNPSVHKTIADYAIYIWPAFSHFIPFAILLVCNAGIIIALRRASAGRRETTTQKVKDSSRKVTMTLIIIVFLYCLLVFPGEVWKFVHPSGSNAVQGALNVLQSLNFAFNFVLYCLVNPTFRTTTKALLMCRLAEVRQHGHRSTTRMTELRSKSTRNDMV